MAKIIENIEGRRQIKLNFADIQAVVQEYQTQFERTENVTELCKYFEYFGIYLVEDI